MPLADVIQVVLRAMLPLIGALFLGWSAGNLLFIYCADTLASIYVVCVLACARLFPMEPVEGPGWWQRLCFGAQLALTALMPFVVIAIPLAVTMGMVLVMADFDWSNALHDRGLWLAAAAQFGAAAGLLLRDYDAALADPDADRHIKGRFGLAFLRWVIVLMAAWSVLAALPFFPIVLVAVCTGATIALELAPNRVLRAFSAAELADPQTAPKLVAAGKRKRRWHAAR